MRSKAIFLALLAFAFGAQAVPVSREQARAIAQMWASRGKRLGVRMGTEVEEVSEYEPSRGGKFFAVRMKGGTVFTAGDTRANPVLAFTRERIEKLDPKSPLYKLLSSSSQATGGAEAPRQWARLQAKADRIAGSPVPIESEEEIDDIRVSPLLTTKWGQSTVVDANGVETNCFNFYTPPTRTVIKEDMAGGYAETNESVNCVCGCVATAMAQLMRYWCWPQGEVASFKNEKCSAPSDTSILRGVFWDVGDFLCLSVEQNPTAETNLTTVAGAYDWESMLEVPDNAAVEANCKAIGKLTYDCGVSVGMDYNLAELDGSSILSSEMMNIVDAFKKRFAYTNAVLCTSTGLTGREAIRQQVIFANLDAKCPVLLLITGSGGHAVVGDGYGFDSDTGENLPYVHLNMGWQGQCDVWYNLPYVDIDEDDNPESFSGFNTIDGAVYNVFTNTTGWIVSGRVLDAAGQPVLGAKVALRDETGAVVGECVTEDASGIYAFIVPRGERQYDVLAENEGGTKMADRLVDIKDDAANGSNSWGNDLTLKDPTVRVLGVGGEERLFASLDSALRAATNDDDRVEILHTTKLRRDTFLGNDLVLTAVKATPSKIQRQDGATISITNGIAFFTNVVFALEKATPVLVGADAKIKVAGRVELDDIASMTPGIRLEGVDGLELAGELLNGLTIASPASMAGQFFGSYSCDPVTATRSAGRIVTTDPDLVGQAMGAGKLAWQRAEEVDPLVAVAYLDGETPAYYRTLDKLIGKISGEADIVVMRSGCTLTEKLTIVGNSSIRGEDANISVNVVGLSDAAQFTVNSGASLSVSNLTFAAYEGMALFLVGGGNLTLENGTVIDGAVGTAERNSGSIAVSKGVVTMRDGVRIVNCRAGGGSANGGAIWLAGKDCALNLKGGEITGCFAKSYGGGIYVGGNATLNLSGPVNVTGNSSGNNPVDNIYLAAATSSFNLVGEVSGSVGVRHSGWTSGDEVGDAFIAVDPSLDPDAVARSCKAFSNDTGAGLSAAVSADGLVWAARPPYTGEVEPEEALDLVIYNDGTPQAVTNYYESFAYAYASLTNDATIVVLGEELFTGDVTVTRKVLIRTNEPEGTAGLYRASECKFEIAAGGSLTLEDIVMSGYYGGEGTLLYVTEGGSLTLGDGARVCDVYGDGSRSAGGVVVWGGEFRMLPGSEICNCGNDYPQNASEAVPPANVGVGGGLLVDHGTVYLEGGWVDGCWAERAAGVYIGNKSTVCISGDMLICDNFTGDGELSNLTVEDLSTLVLKGVFLGDVGVSEGISCDSNVFGRVDAEFYADALTRGHPEEVAVSAAHFWHDVRDVHGLVVTNGEEALLVWEDAVNDGVYVDPEKGPYAVMFKDEMIIPPPAVEDLAYNGNEQTGVMEDEGYVVSGNVATNAGTYTATVTLEPGYVWWDLASYDSREVEWSIDRATYDMDGVIFHDTTFPYDGQPHGIYVQGILPAGVTVAEYLNNDQTDPGTYTVVAKFAWENPDNYYPVADRTATLKIIENPDPPPGPTPHWEVVTNHPTPIAFKSINRVSDTEWTLVVTNRVRYCNYRLIWTTDLKQGFVSTGDWEHVVHEDCATWTTNVITTGGAWFWRAEGADGTNMVLKTEE